MRPHPVSVRTLVADALGRALADTGSPVRVRDTLRALDGPQQPVAIVIATALTPAPVRHAWYQGEVSVHVASPHDDPDRAEDDLDAALADVLHALDQPDAEGIIWTTARRGTLDGKYPSWEITCTATILKDESR